MFFTNSIKNNGSTTAVMGMPFKPNTMAQGSMLANGRAVYIDAMTDTRNQNNIKNKKYYQAPMTSSQRMQIRKNKAIGKSSTKQGLASNATMSFRSQDTTSRNTRLAKCRSGGCVSPAKKGAAANPFKSGGKCC